MQQEIVYVKLPEYSRWKTVTDYSDILFCACYPLVSLSLYNMDGNGQKELHMKHQKLSFLVSSEFLEGLVIGFCLMDFRRFCGHVIAKCPDNSFRIQG